MKHPNTMRDRSATTRPRPPECSEVLAALPLYVGQDLDTAELDKVALHLEGCASCAAQHGRALAARAAFASGAWVASDSEGPSLWAGVRAGLVTGGLIGGRPRLVSEPQPSRAVATVTTGAAVTPGAVGGARLPRGRWWIGSGAAAAAVLFAFGLSGLLGPVGTVGTSGGGFISSPVDVDGTRPTVRLEAPGHLRRPGADRRPLLQDAVEWLPEQGIYVPLTSSPQPSLVEGPRQLRPVQK